MALLGALLFIGSFLLIMRIVVSDDVSPRANYTIAIGLALICVSAVMVFSGAVEETTKREDAQRNAAIEVCAADNEGSNQAFMDCLTALGYKVIK